MLEALDETGVDWEASLAESSLIAKKLLVIRDGLEVHEAVDVYFCKKPEAVHECRFVHADDTVHTTEFPERYVPIVVTPDTVLSLFCPAPACPAKHRLMMGDPFAMHVAGHGAAVSVPVSVDGTMDLAALPAGKEMLLFTLVKTGAEELYRKYVWVVTKR